MSIKTLQTNIGRARAAHDLAHATVKKRCVDILLVSEPNKSIITSREPIKDESQNVAVLLISKKLPKTYKREERLRKHHYCRMGALLLLYIAEYRNGCVQREGG